MIPNISRGHLPHRPRRPDSPSGRRFFLINANPRFRRLSIFDFKGVDLGFSQVLDIHFKGLRRQVGVKHAFIMVHFESRPTAVTGQFEIIQ
jgi:hypothetical protein